MHRESQLHLAAPQLHLATSHLHRNFDGVTWPLRHSAFEITGLRTGLEDRSSLLRINSGGAVKRGALFIGTAHSAAMDDKDLYAGLIRLHILHHAVEEGAVYGLWMIEELGRHGYRLSPGTLYPILHSLERKGYLRSTREREGSRFRRTYVATPNGRKALAGAKERVWELFGELFEPAHSREGSKHRRAGADHQKARNGQSKRRRP